jgi:ABC-type sugar transport system permease subunit
MEGATAWEYFWKITVPYISPMLIASLVYTIVDSFVDPSNEVMTLVLNQSKQWEHGYSAAMAWAYFAIIGVILAIVLAIINKFVYYEVD